MLRKEAAMTLRTSFQCLTACLLLAGAGCTSMLPSQGGLVGLISARRGASEETEEEVEPPIESLTRPTSLRETDRDDSAVAERTGRTPPVTDAATLMLIETELRDAPAEERREWMEYLRTVDPAMVPYILQSRRMAMNSEASGNSMTAGSARDRGGMNVSPPVAAHPGQSPLTAGGGPRSNLNSYIASPGQMQLNAPEPAGRMPIVSGVTPFGRPPVQSTTYAAPHNNGSVQQLNGIAQSNYSGMQSAAAELPVISPNVAGGTSRQSAHFDTAPVQAANETQDLTTIAPQPQGAYLQEELQRLIALFQAEVAAAHPGLSESEKLDYVRRHVYLRMLYLIAEQPQLAQQAVPGLSPSEQEFWTELFWAMSNYFDAQSVPDAGDRAALTVTQLAAAQRQLQHAARLELRNVSFCYKINSFGSFDRYERDEFRAGQPVLLYAEVGNFESQPTTAGLYKTRLRSHIEIRRGNAQGEIVEQNDFPATEDLCRNLRSDYFHSYKIDLPQHLTPGPYSLVLGVEDELGGKVAIQSIDFLVR
jgi:hypothetical protein